MIEFSFFTIIFFLSSGLFLGWSLGANDAANIFGTAVSTKMIRFKTAAIIASVFVVIGAVFGGSGTPETLNKLGNIQTLPASFCVALAAALAVYIMTYYGLPVSTSQSIVGAIIGWNIFMGFIINVDIVYKIVISWIASPIIAGIFSFFIFKIVKNLIENSKIHLIKLDHFTRIGLIVVGSFGAYSLGSNNIANVMGVFLNSIQINKISIFSNFTLQSDQLLFLLGAIAISVGIITYSKKVMSTVGKNIFRLSPVTAFVVVFSTSLVLFLFASKDLKMFMESINLPSFPMVPISSSQAIVGSILGISVAKRAKNIKFKILGKIAAGWITTPLIAIIISYIFLFLMNNLFIN